MKPSDTFRNNIWVTPFFEDDVAGLVRLLGAGHVLAGSDYPHPEGLARPAEFADELDGTGAATSCAGSCARTSRSWSEQRRAMTLDPRTPVLVGVGAVSQREADPARAQEPLALMAAALERAAEDAGSRALLARADSIRAPRGFWSYPDPCRLLAERFGATRRADRDRRDRRAPDDAARARGGRHRGRARRRRAGRRRRGPASRAARARRRDRRAAHAAGARDAGLGAAAARADPERARDARGAGAAGRPVRDARERAARGRGRLARGAPARDRGALGGALAGRGRESRRLVP